MDNIEKNSSSSRLIILIFKKKTNFLALKFDSLPYLVILR